jgi:Arc/MetJ-type ribon-helix-helix transcriptional regulator
MSEEFKRRFEEVLKRFEERFKKLVNEVEDLISRGEVSDAYRLWRRESREILKELRASLRELEQMAEESGTKVSVDELRDVAGEVMRNISSYIENLYRKMGDIGANIVVALPSIDRIRSIVVRSFKSISDLINDVIKGVNDVIEEMFREVPRRSTEVISARIGVKELEIIDELVEIGIFKSRSEAVAYFIKKGIDASRDLINKALEQAKKIKEMRETLRREFFGEEEGEKKEKN